MKPLSFPIGTVCGKFTVMSEPIIIRGAQRWTAKCACGVGEISATSTVLKQKAANNIGCQHCKPRGLKHGHAGKNGAYSSWYAMKQRCTNPKNKSYPRYGGRGIKVHPDWMHFENFLACMGERPDGMTLDRKNTDGDYEPDNCKWATDGEQAENRSDCQPQIVAGVRYPTIAAVARAYCVSSRALAKKLRKGIKIEQALGIE